MFVIIILTFVFLTIIAHYLNERQRKKGMPPGPVGLPLVGYIPFMPSDYGDKLLSLRQKYGKIFTLTLGSADVVFISDFDAMKKVMSQDKFNFRPDYSVLTFYIPNSMAMCE